MQTPCDEDLLAGLAAAGRIRVEEIEKARRVQDSERGSLVWLCVRLGLLAEQDVARHLAQALGLALVDPSGLPGPAADSPVLPVRYLTENRILPMFEDDGSVTLIAADPRDATIAHAVELATQRKARMCVGIASEINTAIERLFGEDRVVASEAVESSADLAAMAATDDVDHLRDLASEAPIIRLVNQILRQAVEAGASDVHLEPFEDRLRVRFRIDGVLYQRESPPARAGAAILSRVKILAHMDIAERRLPQDGRIRFRNQGEELDVRVSTVPTVHGESLVMRILDHGRVLLDLGQIGFDEPIVRGLRSALARPHGIVLVTGPTGSGKTTTLYAALGELNATGVKIITVEDPVEYQIQGVNQIQVKQVIGLDFPAALKSILRQDPDVILIGEMRDPETARIAIQSALTGHLVLSTLHTNSAVGAIHRMLDLGLEDYLIASSVNAVLGQRLLRRLCANCRVPAPADPALQRALALPADDVSRAWFQAGGCAKCAGTGYRGRSVIGELLVVGESFRQAIISGADGSSLREQAARDGMRTMLEDGLDKCSRGETSAAEVLRVTHAD